MNQETKRKLIIASAAIAALLVLAVTAMVFLPHLENFYTVETQEKLKAWIDSFGIFGIFVMLGVQMLQVIIAIIPGEAVEIVAGVLYGPLGGLIICSIGCILASALVFKVSERFGKKLLNFLFGAERIKKWNWIHDSKRLGTIVFILFLVPGTPKDMLTYFVGITEMSLKRFLLISTFARVPSVFSSTIMGSSIIEGRWELSIIVFVLTAIFGIVGILAKENIIEFCRRIKSRANGAGKNHDE